MGYVWTEVAWRDADAQGASLPHPHLNDCLYWQDVGLIVLQLLEYHILPQIKPQASTVCRIPQPPVLWPNYTPPHPISIWGQGTITRQPKPTPERCRGPQSCAKIWQFPLTCTWCVTGTHPIISFNPFNNMWGHYCYYQFYRWGNRGSTQLGNLPQITELVGDRGRVWF